MSGIVALFQREDRRLEREDLWSMLDAAPYRGPDGMHVRLWPSAGLGHAQMAVTPEERQERQPIESLGTGCAIACDARLDNRKELIKRLPVAAGAAPSDAELILLAYETWGTDALPMLLGDFAFVIWDPRAGRMVCARDTSGQRTLFYRMDARCFAAASEIQQLFQDPAYSPAPDEEKIRDFLLPVNMYRNEKDGWRTFFAGVRAVPAGHVLVVDARSTQLSRYWELAAPAEIHYRREADYAEHYRALFFEVVRARLRSSGPLGVMLSGGLDSSSIACVAQELYRSGEAQNRGFRSFSTVFDGLDCDERGLIGEIADKYGFETRFSATGDYGGRLQIEPRGFLESPNMGIAAARDALFAAAEATGTRVLLTGDLADGCVLGSRQVFDSLLRRGRLGTFWRHFRAYRRIANESIARTAGMRCLLPLLPLELQKPLMAADTGRALRAYGVWMFPAWMPAELRRGLCGTLHERTLAAIRARRFANPSRQDEYDLLYPPEVARQPAPWPLQIWRPFADRRLHEFLLAIPPELKFEPHPQTDEYYAGAKRLVRSAMRGILPESVRTRTSKTVFKAFLTGELQHQWPLYEAAFGPKGSAEIVQRGYVDQAQFWQRLNEVRAGAWGSDVVYLMQLVGLETWLRALKLPRPQSITIPPPWSGAHMEGEPVEDGAALSA